MQRAAPHSPILSRLVSCDPLRPLPRSGATSRSTSGMLRSRVSIMASARQAAAAGGGLYDDGASESLAGSGLAGSAALSSSFKSWLFR